MHAISFNLERKRALPEVSTVFEKEEKEANGKGKKKKKEKKSNIFAHFKADQVCSLPDRVCLNECVLLLVVEQLRERRK